MQDFHVFDPRYTRFPRLVDLRSDTVTRPTAQMYDSMRQAPVGDDGLDGDPSVKSLEETVATMLGKGAGLYVPTCTMANLLAVLAHTQRHQEVLVEANAHIFTNERTGSMLSGVTYTPIEGDGGAMDVNRLSDLIRTKAEPMNVGMVAIETSHNNAGGTVLSIEHMKQVHALAHEANIPVHIDGARLMNASVALNLSANELAKHAESVALCLSKGLSAPVGAVLVGDNAVIERARAYRKAVGGTQRQSGIMAAAGLCAVRTMASRLSEDHATARAFSSRLNALGASLIASTPQTNIVQVKVGGTGMTSHQWVDALGDLGVLTRAWGDEILRCVTHRHIDDKDVEYAATSFERVLEHCGRD